MLFSPRKDYICSEHLLFAQFLENENILIFMHSTPCEEKDVAICLQKLQSMQEGSDVVVSADILQYVPFVVAYDNINRQKKKHSVTTKILEM